MSWFRDALGELEAIARPILSLPGAIGTFDDPLWFTQKVIYGFNPKPGEFIGEPTLDIHGNRNYLFLRESREGRPQFAFKRSNGEIVTPKAMATDDGSIPRIAWSVPGLDPWTFSNAFLVHDWQWMTHHAGGPAAFDETNLTLAEGVMTLMLAGVGRQDWRVLLAIHAGVSSPIGRRLWDTAWTPKAISEALPEGI